MVGLDEFNFRVQLGLILSFAFDAGFRLGQRVYSYARLLLIENL